MAALITTPVWAAVPSETLFDCDITAACTQQGRCTPQENRVVFQLTEKQVERHGEGTYDIAHDGVTAIARNLTPFGPFQWVEGQGDGVINSLTPIGSKPSETAEDDLGFMVWSQMTITDPSVGTVKFLTCKEG